MLIYPFMIRCEYYDRLIETTHFKTRNVRRYANRDVARWIRDAFICGYRYAKWEIRDIEIQFLFEYNKRNHTTRTYSLLFDPDLLDDIEAEIRKSEYPLYATLYYDHFLQHFLPDKDPLKVPLLEKLLGIAHYIAACDASEKIKEKKNDPTW